MVCRLGAGKDLQNKKTKKRLKRCFRGNEQGKNRPPARTFDDLLDLCDLVDVTDRDDCSDSRRSTSSNTLFPLSQLSSIQANLPWFGPEPGFSRSW